jgi:hypothetical protein
MMVEQLGALFSHPSVGVFSVWPTCDWSRCKPRGLNHLNVYCGWKSVIWTTYVLCLTAVDVNPDG